jgi:hypothetical protein
MISEPLQLQHREELNGTLKAICGRLSEFSFANLFLFRKVHDYQLVKNDGCVFISGLTNDKQRFVLPVCKQNIPDLERINCLLDQYGMLFPVADCSIKYFDNREYKVYHNEDDSDYIYTVEKMSTYSGRHLSKKRNLLKQFFRNHEYSREVITDDNVKKAHDILDKWQDEISTNIEETDFHAAHEALNYYQALDLNGYIYTVDGEAGAYLLGERLTDDTYVLHFAKGLTRYKGIYQFIYNDLAKELKKECFTYINFEQDLGLQSLRQAKSSYKPDHMGMKYRVVRV